MVTCPPFRVFVNSVGTTWHANQFLPESEFKANIFPDISHLTRWYWLLCRITIDLRYTINGDFEIHHTYTMDETKTLPPQRISFDTMTKFTLNQRDPSLEITASGTWDFKQMILNEAYAEAHHPSKMYPLDYQNDNLFPLDTKVGFLFDFVEQADNGDFSLATKNVVGVGTTLLDSYTAKFDGIDLPFCLTTNYPEDIDGRIDAISLTPEFFVVEQEREE